LIYSGVIVDDATALEFLTRCIQIERRLADTWMKGFVQVGHVHVCILGMFFTLSIKVRSLAANAGDGVVWFMLGV